MNSELNCVHLSPLFDSGRLPLLAQPAAPGLDLTEFLAAHREQVTELLVQRGGILFRGFGIDSPEKFDRAMHATCHEFMTYKERSSPRTLVRGQVYTSTDYPADQSIFPHNEHSYASRFPTKIAFCCVEPAKSGGETPIVDCRRVTARIPVQIRDRFRDRGGWQYVRTLSSDIGLPWQTVYQTEDKHAVEQYCRDNDTTWEWMAEDRLRTVQIRSTTVRHPATGEEIWFNHATFFNVGTLPEMLRDFLLQEFGPQGLPNNTFYGDGRPYEEETLRALQEAYLAEQLEFHWEKGDMLLLDNLLMAHARNPFEGQRSVLVIMADAVKREALPR